MTSNVDGNAGETDNTGAMSPEKVDDIQQLQAGMAVPTISEPNNVGVSRNATAFPASFFDGAGLADSATIGIASQDDAQRRKDDLETAWPDYEESLLQATTIDSFEDVWRGVALHFAEQYDDFLYHDDQDGATTGEKLLRGDVFRVEPPNLDKFHLPWQHEMQAESLKTQRVEENLNAALAAAERTHNLRASRDEKAARAAALALDVKEFLDNDRVRRDEIRAGVEVLPFIEAVRAWAKNKSLQATNQRREERVKATFSKHYSPSPQNPEEDVTKWKTYGMLGQVWRGAMAGVWHERLVFGPDIVMPIPQNDTSTTDLRANFVAQGVYGQATYATDLAAAGLINEQELASGNRNEAAHQNIALRERAIVAIRTAMFNRRRHAVAVASTELKIRAASAKGGALNYAEAEARERGLYYRSLAEVLCNMMVAAEGMYVIYGYKKPIPEVLLEMLSEATRARLKQALLHSQMTQKDSQVDQLWYAEDSPLIQATFWLRDAVNWLSMLRQREERFAITISVVQLSGKPWPKKVAGHTAKFHVDRKTIYPNSSDADQRLRILGIAAEIMGTTGSQTAVSYWRAEVSLPDTGVYGPLREQPTPNDQPKAEIISYQYHAPIVLGRVRLYREGREMPSFEGSSILLNFDPVGEWTLKIDQMASTDHDGIEINDVILHLAVASV